MNYRIALLAVIEILTAVSMGVILLSVTYKGLRWYGKKYHHIEETNMAFNIFKAFFLFSIGLGMSEVIHPLVSYFRLISKESDHFLQLFLDYVLNGGIFIAIAYGSSIVICLLGVTLYARLTPIDEFEEIKNNKVGVAIIAGSIMVALTLLTKDGIALLIESIIPYPALPPL